MFIRITVQNVLSCLELFGNRGFGKSSSHIFLWRMCVDGEQSRHSGCESRSSHQVFLFYPSVQEFTDMFQHRELIEELFLFFCFFGYWIYINECLEQIMTHL